MDGERAEGFTKGYGSTGARRVSSRVDPYSPTNIADVLMLAVTFVRRKRGRDRVYVRRPDNSSTAWDFPTYGDRLPHDLCHLVVEEALGITEGFWGLVDQGVEVRLVHNEATLVRDGRPIAEKSGVDLAELRGAEEAVAKWTAWLRGTGDRPEPPHGVPVEVAVTIGARLGDLERQWASLDDGQSLALTFTRHP